MTKRTCGECENLPSTVHAAGYCGVKLPMWLSRIDCQLVHREADATHCETFTPKINFTPKIKGEE